MGTEKLLSFDLKFWSNSFKIKGSFPKNANQMQIVQDHKEFCEKLHLTEMKLRLQKF